VRAVLTIALAASTLAVAQPDRDARFESLLAEAHNAQARSDFLGAAASYRQAVAIRPDIAELWSNLGLMQHQSAEYTEAAEAFGKALRLNQSLFVPNLFLGLDLLQLKRPGEAIPYLLASEKLQPQDPQPALALGRTFHALWEPEKSGRWYRRAVVLAPRNGEAWYGLGLAYFGMAEAAGAKLTGSFGGSAYDAELTAGVLAEQGRLTEGIHAYRDLLALKEPSPPCSHSSYGFVLLRNGNAEEAQQEFQRDLASCPAARVGAARLLFESGEREKGLTMLAELAKQDQAVFSASLPRFWEGLDAQQLEALLAKLRQSADAIARVVEAAVQEGARSTPVLQPENPLPDLAGLMKDDLKRRASGAFFAGDLRTTALASDRLRQKYPNDAAGWYWAVRANQKLSVAALARAGEAEPDSPRIHALLGDVYRRRGMFDEAREEYSKVLAISPDSVAGLAGLAATDLADGRLEQAQVTARKALARSPEDSEINLQMGEILVAQREYADAEPYLEHSLQARPDLLPRVHALLGEVFARTGRSKEALNELTQGLASDEDGSVHYQLARLYKEAGDERAAAAAFEKSKQIRASHDELARKALTPIN
jgi:tetratricopeptide (TPR) repeat protein